MFSLYSGKFHSGTTFLGMSAHNLRITFGSRHTGRQLQ